jgi:hypothetical protein
MKNNTVDSRISFGTKEQLNKARQEAFLKLDPIERFFVFIEDMKLANKLYGKVEKPENFIIEKTHNLD